MRKFGLKILELYLKITSSLFLARYKPKIIGVTGSVGKSSTKEAIYTVLSAKFKVRRSLGSYNNEIGVPLTIMDEESSGSNIFGWIIVFFRAIGNLIYDKDYPQILVLEMGVDKPRDLEYLLNFIKPKIAVITSIGATHLEKMHSEQEVLKEKSKLALRLPKKGIAILNFDDTRLKRLGLDISRKVVFYGLNSQANMYATEIKYERTGMSFNINYAGSVIPVDIASFGTGQIYAALAACAVATILGMDLISASHEIRKIKGLKGRLKLFSGKKEIFVLDDSYNSNPMSASSSLETAARIKESLGAQRLVAVLGDMLELGKISRRAHINLGREAAKTANMVIAVGNEAKNIYSGAEETLSGSALWFADSESAAKMFFLPLFSLCFLRQFCRIFFINIAFGKK
ncbi:MAG: UDP-N-acetylmuramoyl-tripeptide--D-alanyl-D-alanine ligase [Candidatus Berkelbacteria bacterium]|nr:UDP-N-acetylmuramoyl-tripeptide--D-alanyl-D-alanine ligase [Candidatus Berkelbacteria bacterium]